MVGTDLHSLMLKKLVIKRMQHLPLTISFTGVIQYLYT